MPILEKNNPLILKVSEFQSFDEYLSSLTKSARKNLKSILSKNKGIEYSEIEYDAVLVQEFMDMWSRQPLSNGEFPLWGSWNSTSIVSGHSGDVILFVGKSEGRVISIHFIFRWGRYVYCNAPLYDKSEHKEIELAKWMWVKMIGHLIDNTSVKYIDLVGPNWIQDWRESISNRSHPDQAGDFGYKWKFIPEAIKNNPDSQPKYEIKTCRSCGWKWLQEDILSSGCNCMRKLLIVAHPDDEAIFFGNWLLNNKGSVKVICITGGKDPVRRSEFIKSMSICGILDFEIWDYEYSLLPLDNKESIVDDLYRIKFSSQWDMIVTHGRYGEYGHLQHIEVHEMVTSIFDRSKIHVFEISGTPLSKSELENKTELNKAHHSQYVTGFLEILNSTTTGSDWYKHTVNQNLVEYESIVPLSSYRGLLNIAIIDPIKYKDYPFYAFYQQTLSFLVDRGNNVDVRNEDDDLSEYDVSLVFMLDQAIELAKRKEKFVFIINNDTIIDGGLSLEPIEHLKWAASRSVRSIVRNKATRDVMGNPNNVIFLPLFRGWYEIIRDIESNILMGLRWCDLNGNNLMLDDFCFFEFSNERLTFKYMGDLEEDHQAVLIDPTGNRLISYDLNLTFGNSYWIGFYQRWLSEDLTLEVVKNGKPVYRQALKLRDI